MIHLLCISTSERMLAHAFVWSKMTKNIRKWWIVFLHEPYKCFWLFSTMRMHAQSCVCWLKYTTSNLSQLVSRYLWNLMWRGWYLWNLIGEAVTHEIASWLSQLNDNYVSRLAGQGTLTALSQTIPCARLLTSSSNTLNNQGFYLGRSEQLLSPIANSPCLYKNIFHLILDPLPILPNCLKSILTTLTWLSTSGT